MENDNLFENIKFGDKFFTKENIPVIFWYSTNDKLYFITDTKQYIITDKNGIADNCDSSFDIISKYINPSVDEYIQLKDELDTLNMTYLSQVSLWKSKYTEAENKLNKRIDTVSDWIYMVAGDGLLETPNMDKLQENLKQYLQYN